MPNVIFTNENIKKFDKIYKKLESDDEFEVMFGGYRKNNSINMQQFSNLLKYLKKFSEEKKYKIVCTNTLDICYNYDKKNFNIYRIAINGIDNINTIMAVINNRKNHSIYSILASKILNGNKNITIVNKLKSPDNIFNIDDYDVRVRMSKEKKVTKKELEELLHITDENRLDIGYRFKNRISIIVESNSECELNIDLTSVKQDLNINRLEKAPSKYELEIDFSRKKKISEASNKKYKTKIMDLTVLLKKVLQQSNNLLSNTTKSEILTRYKKLIYDDPEFNTKSSYTMTSQSLEIIHLVDYLPNKYSVTDKADGDRYLGMIYKNRLYFITTNLDVKDSGRTISEKNKKYNDTIIDGEYIYLPEHNKYLFTTFDILFLGSKDVRDIPSLEERLQYLDEVMDACFDYKPIKKDIKNYELKEMIKRNDKVMREYIDGLNKTIVKCKEDHIVYRKFFQFVVGISNTEVFNYTYQLWDLFTKDSK